MSENKIPNENEILEPVEDVAEEVVEAAEEVYEDVAEMTEEDFADEIPEDAEEFYEENQEDIAFDADADQEPVKAKKISVSAIVSIVLAVLLVLSIFTNGFKSLFPNKYNALGYPGSEVTIEQIAEACGMTLSEFLATCNLPADMPGNTRQEAAIYALPTGIFAQMNALTFDQIKEMLMLPDTVTEDTLWSDAQGEAPLRAYVGEESLPGFKENYGLGDEVTVDTTWKEVRDIVYQKDMIDQAKGQWDQVISLMNFLNAPVDEAPAVDTTDIAPEEIPAETPVETPAEDAPVAE